MSLVGNEDFTLLELLPTHCKRASPDYSSSYEDEDVRDHKRHKSDILIVYEDDGEEEFGDHIVPLESALLQRTLQSADNSLDGIESSWVTSLLDSDRSPLATLEFSFIDDGFSLEGGFL
jgi:hypothetical protein